MFGAAKRLPFFISRGAQKVLFCLKLTKMHAYIFSFFRQIGLFLLCLSLPFLLTAQTQTDWLGDWSGRLEVQGMEIPVVFHIRLEAGELALLMDSPKQGQFDLKFDKIEVNGPKLKASWASANIVYEGQWSAEGIKGQWKQNGLSLPLLFKKVGADELPQAPKRPQTPQPPFPYIEEQHYVITPKTNIRLEGTLTLPPNATDSSKVPAILLISGSGPQDRNSEIFGHQPFAVIADHFSRRGFAVFRYDDRGTGKSEGQFAGSTTHDLAQDADACLQYLSQDPRINKEQLVVMGHSEGGLIGFMLGAKWGKKIGAVVSLAGPALPIKELMLQQNYDLGKQAGIAEETLQTQRNFLISCYARAVKKDRKSEDKFVADMLNIWRALPQKERLQLAEIGLVETGVEQLGKALYAPWFRSFLRIDPKKYLKRIRCPLLALNGGEDIQVAGPENLERISQLLLQKEKYPTAVVLLPRLNHLFQHCESCTIADYQLLEETFAPEVLKAMQEWLEERFALEDGHKH